LINEIDAVASTHIATLAPRSSIKSLPSKRSANSPLLAHNLKRSHLPPSLSSKFQARLESNLVGGMYYLVIPPEGLVTPRDVDPLSWVPRCTQYQYRV
jgi:hypothetical protein